MATAVRKFLEQNDLYGKDIYFVATHGGKVGHTFYDMKKLTKAELKDTLEVYFNNDGMVTNEKLIIKFVCVTTSVTTLNDNITRMIEPKASSSTERLRTIRELKSANEKIKTGILMTPLMPYITASRENVESMFQKAIEIKADYLATGWLSLRGKSGDKFYEFLREQKPALLEKYRKIYSSSGSIQEKYERQLQNWELEMHRKYGIKTIEEVIKLEEKYTQLSLLDLESGLQFCID